MEWTMKLIKIISLSLIAALPIFGMEKEELRPLFIDKTSESGYLPADLHQELIKFISNDKKNAAFLLSGINHKDTQQNDFSREEIPFACGNELLSDSDQMFCWPDSSAHESILKFWQIKNGKPLPCQINNKIYEEMNCITAARSGQLFFIGASDGDLRVWEPRKGTSSLFKNIAGASIKGINFYDPKQYLFTIDSTGEIRVFKHFSDRIESYKIFKSKHSIPAKAKLFYHEKKNQLIVYSEYVEVFDVETGTQVFHSDGAKYTFADIRFDRASEKLFASQGKSIYCWDMQNIGTKEKVRTSYGFNHSIGQFIYDSFSRLVFTVSPISTNPAGLQIKLLDLENKKSIPIAYISSARSMMYDAQYKKLFCVRLNGDMEVLNFDNSALQQCTPLQAIEINNNYEKTLQETNNKRKM